MNRDIGPEGFKDPYSLLTYLVPAGGKLLLAAGGPGLAESDGIGGMLTRLGFSVEETRKDLRLLGLPPESLDAIWWNDANTTYSIEDAFRILQSLFRGLRPKHGILVFTFAKEDEAKEKSRQIWSVRTVMTLLRQSGLQLFHTFENPTDHLFFCQRI